MDKNDFDGSFVDPDPISITALGIAAASFVLQFIQTAYQVKPARTSEPANARIMHLEREVRDLRQYLAQIARAVDRGAQSPEAQFYDLPFRIGQGPLLLEATWNTSLKDSLHHAYTKVGAVSIWVNDIVAHDPAMSAAIAAEILPELKESTKKLNEFIASGGTNRQIMAEVNHALDVFEKALSRLLSSN